MQQNLTAQLHNVVLKIYIWHFYFEVRHVKEDDAFLIFQNYSYS